MLDIGQERSKEETALTAEPHCGPDFTYPRSPHATFSNGVSGSRNHPSGWPVLDTDETQDYVCAHSNLEVCLYGGMPIPQAHQKIEKLRRNHGSPAPRGIPWSRPATAGSPTRLFRKNMWPRPFLGARRRKLAA